MKFRLLAAAAVTALLLGSPVHAQTAAPAPTAPASSTPAPRASTPARPVATAGAMAATQFKTEAEAKAHCPGDTVVWANKDTKVYHLSGSRYYGKTKVGAYMCQKDADAAKFHAARSRASTRHAAPAAPAGSPPTASH